MSEIIKSIENAQLRTDRPEFSVGDTLRVFVKVVEGNRERLQAFEGTVIARRNGLSFLYQYALNTSVHLCGDVRLPDRTKRAGKTNFRYDGFSARRFRNYGDHRALSAFICFFASSHDIRHYAKTHNRH